jgi:hypothetical protein
MICTRLHFGKLSTVFRPSANNSGHYNVHSVFKLAGWRLYIQYSGKAIYTIYRKLLSFSIVKYSLHKKFKWRFLALLRCVSLHWLSTKTSSAPSSSTSVIHTKIKWHIFLCRPNLTEICHTTKHANSDDLPIMTLFYVLCATTLFPIPSEPLKDRVWI